LLSIKTLEDAKKFPSNLAHIALQLTYNNSENKDATLSAHNVMTASSKQIYHSLIYCL